MVKERGAAVILITHDMGVIAETTDRVAVLYAGRLVEEGPTADVIAAPRHPYTAGLMASTPNLDAVSVISEQVLSGKQEHNEISSTPNNKNCLSKVYELIVFRPSQTFPNSFQNFWNL